MSNLAWINKKELNNEQFYNRNEEIVNIMALLNLTSNGNAPSLLVTGIRSVGKTVFLNKVKKELEQDYLVVYMDFSRAECYQKNNMSPIGLLEYYCNEVIMACNKKQLKNIEYKLKKYFKTHDFHVDNISMLDKIPIALFKSEKILKN